MTDTIGRPDETRIVIRMRDPEPPPPPRFDDDLPETIVLLDGELHLSRSRTCGSSYAFPYRSDWGRTRWMRSIDGLVIAVEAYTVAKPRSRRWRGEIGTKRAQGASLELVIFTMNARLRTLGKLLVGKSKPRTGATVRA